MFERSPIKIKTFQNLSLSMANWYCEICCDHKIPLSKMYHLKNCFSAGNVWPWPNNVWAWQNYQMESISKQSLAGCPEFFNLHFT